MYIKTPASIEPEIDKFRGVISKFTADYGIFITTTHFYERAKIGASQVNPTITFAKYNVQVEASWRMAKRGDWLPCLFVQYNYGYGETMIDYDKLHSKIRIGISLMNNKLNLY